MSRFPREDRLRKRRDFLRVQRIGLRSKSPCLVLTAKRAFLKEGGRAGLTVSKAVGKAHVRNLIKRRLRQLLRENKWVFANHDLVVTAQPICANSSYSVLQNDFLEAANRLNKMFAQTKGVFK